MCVTVIDHVGGLFVGRAVVQRDRGGAHLGAGFTISTTPNDHPHIMRTSARVPPGISAQNAITERARSSSGVGVIGCTGWAVPEWLP